MKRIPVTEHVIFYTGVTDKKGIGRYPEDEKPALYIKDKQGCIQIPVYTKEQYLSLTEQIFWFLVLNGRLKCPECGSEMDVDASPGDSSVGMVAYVATWCTNPDCYFTDIKTPEKEQELIRAVFPLYWKWKEEKNE